MCVLAYSTTIKYLSLRAPSQVSGDFSMADKKCRCGATLTYWQEKDGQCGSCGKPWWKKVVDAGDDSFQYLARLMEL
eukprot:g26061.t1